jgi:hypothetical protein
MTVKNWPTFGMVLSMDSNWAVWAYPILSFLKTIEAHYNTQRSLKISLVKVNPRAG